jgi:acetoin utilization deacetylase AcuC-like enzyme
LADGLVAASDLHDPPRATDDELALVHTSAYRVGFTAGTLGDAAMRRIGFPWSPALVERSYRAVGGTIAAARAARERGIAMNLAGGTHHAFADHGEGFCVFNDVAVAVRVLQRERLVTRAAIVDLDVHQGNGTHAIFAGDDSVFTFSMHGVRNYPFAKVPGCMDIELPDGTTDDAYLDGLARALPRAIGSARADFVVYLAGADVHEGDRLGRLSLTLDGVRRRDAFVIDACREVGLPLAITIAGGYGHDVALTVEAHLGTVRAAAAVA